MVFVGATQLSAFDIARLTAEKVQDPAFSSCCDVNDTACSKCEGFFLVQTAPLMHSDQTSGGKCTTVPLILWTLSSETDVEKKQPLN